MGAVGIYIQYNISSIPLLWDIWSKCVGGGGVKKKCWREISGDQVALLCIDIYLCTFNIYISEKLC